MQSLGKKDLKKLILGVLKIRDYTNTKMKGGRKYVKLTANARNALDKGKYVLSMMVDYYLKRFSL